MLVAKSSTFPAMAAAATTIQAVVSETATHEGLCAAYGISHDELRSTPESAATGVYGGYLLDVALSGDAIALLVALGACVVGYGEVGLWLVRKPRRMRTRDSRLKVTRTRVGSRITQEMSMSTR